MQVALHKLGFPSGFHMGAHGIGTESVRPTIPSDTLLSALLSAWVRLGGNPEAWLRVSSHPRRRNRILRPPVPPQLRLPLCGRNLVLPQPPGVQAP